MAFVDIIVVSYDNPNYLQPCLQSLNHVIGTGLARVIVVNNGMAGSIVQNNPAIRVVDAGRNLGWEGGLKLGLEHSKAPFVCFLNDDTFFPISSALWLNTLLRHFLDPDCAAVGPSSNHILGAQNIWSNVPSSVFRSSFLIGLCFLVRREHLDAAGGIDDTLPGGDDIDLSIRLRKMGKHLIVDKNAFVFHHHSTTGRRVRADWDSIKHQEAYTKALWEKHGLKEYIATMNQQVLSKSAWAEGEEDSEGACVRKWVTGPSVYELGCGDKQTSPEAVGVDIVPKGEAMGGVFNRISNADIVANCFEELPFKNADCLIARHILEHTHDPLKAVQTWRKALRTGGRLIIAVPDEDLGNMIPLNPQHKAAFTKDSLKRLMEIAGYRTVAIEPSGNPISFVGIWEANGVH